MPKRVTKPDPTKADTSLRGRLAYNMKLHRYALNLSQEALADKCELDRTYISGVERCVWNVSLSNLEKIANALGVEAWQLLVKPEA